MFRTGHCCLQLAGCQCQCGKRTGYRRNAGSPSRKVIDGIAWSNTLTDKGDEVPALVEKGKGAFGGPELYGKKMGVIGLGAIGVLVANMAVDFA